MEGNDFPMYFSNDFDIFASDVPFIRAQFCLAANPSWIISL